MSSFPRGNRGRGSGFTNRGNNRGGFQSNNQNGGYSGGGRGGFSNNNNQNDSFGGSGQAGGFRGGDRGFGTGNQNGNFRGGNRGTSGRGGFNSSESRNSFRPNDSNTDRSSIQQIVVTGLSQSKAASNTDGGVRSLKEFLERKTSQSINEYRIEGDQFIFSVKSDHVGSFVRLHGFQFAGTPLSVTAKSSPPTAPFSFNSGSRTSGANTKLPPKVELKESILSILNERYNPQSGLLDLSNLAQNKEVLRLDLFDFQHHTRDESKTFIAILQAFATAFDSKKEMRNAVQSVSLAGNNLESVSTVLSLADQFPELKNLDLSNNNLRTVAALGKWRRKFRNLHELLLNGNPIEQVTPTFHQDIVEWYPTLRMLNGVQVRSEEEATKKSVPRRLLPFKPFTFDDSTGIGEQFLVQFYDNYDLNKELILREYYDAESLFSFSIDSQSAVKPGQQTAPGTWSAHIKGSKNLAKLHGTGAIAAREHTGSVDIQKAWDTLPKTKHPNIRDTERWIIEGAPIGNVYRPGSSVSVNGLLITVHGDFEEEAANGGSVMRSFSRTFTIGPKQMNDGSVRVISDLLVLRAYDGSLEERKQAKMVQALSQLTRMNLEYSTKCLVESGWDWDTALANFERAKNSLPPEAAL